MDEFRQMLKRCLPAPDEGHEFTGVQRLRRTADERCEAQALRFVPEVEHVQDAAFEPARGGTAFLHQSGYLGPAEKFEEVFGLGDVARYPDEIHEAAPEGGMEEQADADMHAHDLGGAQELVGGFGRNIVVVDDREVAYALEPRVHDEVCGVLAALGVGVVNMVVEHGLRPVFGHFEHEVAVQEAAYHGVPAGSGLPEIVGKAELSLEVAFGAHELLHYLNQDAARIDAQEGTRHDQHFFVQGGKSPEPFIGLSLLQSVQKAEYGGGHTQFYGLGKLDDAVGAELGHDAGLTVAVLFHGLAYHGEELVVLRVEVGTMRSHGPS